MIIVWDEPKRQANIAKHGLDFADLSEAYFAEALILPARNNRLKGIGTDKAGVVCVVFAVLGQEGVSIISMRPASAAERKLYAEAIKD